MRNKIRFWLINLANKIGDSSYYDFGSEVVSTIAYKDELYVATKYSLFKLNKGKPIKIEVDKKI